MPDKNKVKVTIQGVRGGQLTIVGGNVVAQPFPEKITPKILREWWHDILKAYGKYSCCAFVLALPTDEQTIKYLTDFGKEIDLISGKDCLVIAMNDSQLMRYGFDENLWRIAINEQVSNGQSIKVANLFSIEYTEFPCMVLFQDIRNSEHLVISLRGMDVNEISQKMRSVFSIVQSAVAQKRNPLHELKHQKNKKELQSAGESIIGNLRSFAGKTFDTAMEAWIQATIKNA
ncbi:MAG: hypothetical protein HND47_17785 [Chloroflexi bacterium]|nr:hypothetical protein [Chloroflexota bacterium]